MEEFIQNFYTVKYSRNLAVYTSDSGDKEEDDNQTIFFEPENEEDEEKEKCQSDKIYLEINKEIPVPIIIDS